MKIWSTLLFILLNFVALALGALLMGDGVPSDWYQNLNKAPWTPPGWVFGAAWTFIMLCFGFFMGLAWHRVKNKKLLLTLYIIHWILNVGWNPLFFDFHWVLIGLVVIIMLFGLMLYFILRYFPEVKLLTLFIFPYVVWLAIATSLNAYIYVFN